MYILKYIYTYVYIYIYIYIYMCVFQYIFRLCLEVIISTICANSGRGITSQLLQGGTLHIMTGTQVAYNMFLLCIFESTITYVYCMYSDLGGCTAQAQRGGTRLVAKHRRGVASF